MCRRTDKGDGGRSVLIEILPAALHRPLTGSFRGGVVSLQWSSAGWAADESQRRPTSAQHHVTVAPHRCKVSVFLCVKEKMVRQAVLRFSQARK